MKTVRIELLLEVSDDIDLSEVIDSIIITNKSKTLEVIDVIGEELSYDE